MNLKNTLFMLVAALLILSSCKKDDENVKPNQLPVGISVTAEIDGNTVNLEWPKSTDPDGDSITYDVELDGTIVKENLKATDFLLTNLRFERPYSGKVIIKDSKGGTVESVFTFTTGFLFFKSYERDGNEYFLEYNEKRELTNIESRSGNLNPITKNASGEVANFGKLSYSFNSWKLITEINDGNGGGSIQYDSKNRMVRMNADYNINPFTKNRVTRKFTYNEKDQMVQVDEDVYNFSTNASRYVRLKLTYNEQKNIDKATIELSFDKTTYALQTSWTLQYDSKKNPWYTISSMQLNFNELYFDGGIIPATFSTGSSNVYIPNWISKNNLTYIKIQTGDEFVEFNYNYTYNEDNYPITAEIKNIS